MTSYPRPLSFLGGGVGIREAVPPGAKAIGGTDPWGGKKTTEKTPPWAKIRVRRIFVPDAWRWAWGQSARRRKPIK